jgi:hypothetical protein
VDLADRGLRHLLEQVPPGEQRSPEAAQAARVLGQVAQVVEVHARREHRPFAAHHHHAHVVVAGGRLHGGAQLGDRLPVERVALLGPVENEMTDRSAILD